MTCILRWTHASFLNYFLDEWLFQQLSNHPPHIVDKEGILSPSALIPFCQFGKTMSEMGVKIKQFKVPVCNSFKPKIINTQLCYEIDLNNYKKPKSIQSDLKSGLIFFVDYNEDRQSTAKKNRNHKEFSFIDGIVGTEEFENLNIFLNTIGLKL